MAATALTSNLRLAVVTKRVRERGASERSFAAPMGIATRTSSVFLSPESVKTNIGWIIRDGRVRRDAILKKDSQVAWNGNSHGVDQRICKPQERYRMIADKVLVAALQQQGMRDRVEFIRYEEIQGPFHGFWKGLLTFQKH